jgi:hypothetical protein
MADIPIAELDALDLVAVLCGAFPALSEEVRRHRTEIERLRRETEATIAAAAHDRKELVLAQARIAALEGAVRAQAA